MTRCSEEVFLEEPGAGRQADDHDQGLVESWAHPGCPSPTQSSADCGSRQQRKDIGPINEPAEDVNEIGDDAGASNNEVFGRV